MDNSKNQPDFWKDFDPEPASAASTPVDVDQPRQSRSGRGWIWTSFVMSAVALIGAIVLPAYTALLALASAGAAWIGIRSDADARKLGFGALITAIVAFVACVAYAIVSYKLMASFWANT